MRKFIAALVLFCGLICVGCTSGTSKQDYDSSFNVTFPDGTKIEKKTIASGSVTTPENAKEPGTLTIGERGGQANISGNWESQAVNYAKSNTYIFYIAALALGVGGGLIIYFSPVYKTFGYYLIGAAAVSLFAPIIIDTIGIYVAYIVLLLIVVGVIWAVAKYFFRKDLFTRGEKAVIKLKAEGKTDEAMAIKRAIDPELDKKMKSAAVINEQAGHINITPK